MEEQEKSMSEFTYFNNCRQWDKDDIDGLDNLIDGISYIKRGTFLKKIDREELREIEQHLGYNNNASQGLTMANDHHVSYFKSTLHDEPVYGFQWSAIEYVFTEQAIDC